MTINKVADLEATLKDPKKFQAALNTLYAAENAGLLTKAYLLDAQRILTEIKAEPKITSKGLRWFSVDHATGCVEPIFWQAKDEQGRTNLSRRKVIHGKKNVTSTPKKREHVVTFGSGKDRTQETFKNVASAMLYRDVHSESLKTNAAARKQINQDPYRNDAELKVLKDCFDKAEKRKELIKQVQCDNPHLSMSQILRHPDIDQHSAPPRIRG